MSILEKMRAYDAQRKQKMLDTSIPPTDPEDIKFHGLGLKPRRPSLRRMIGDQNPLTDEDYEALRDIVKFGRVQE